MVTLLFQFSIALWMMVVILMVVLIAGIIFDIVGTAATAADEAPFHAMGADKVPGSRQAVFLVRHADQVANFCNDVVGDVAGTIGGALIASIVLEFVRRNTFFSKDILSVLAISFVAAFTVGGKSLGKYYAINQANRIVFMAGKILSFFKIGEKKSKKKKAANRSGARKVRRS